MVTHRPSSSRDEPARPPRAGRAAFTLVELMVASSIALAVIGALASMFALFSRTASDTQAIVTMTSQLRSSATRLSQDLAGLTAALRPPQNPNSGAGYFEYIEGPGTDLFRLVVNSGNIMTSTTSITGVAAITATDSILGDVDDVLLFTTRATGNLFVGKYGSNQIESPVAEVAWFCRPMPDQPIPGLTLQNLYRRQLLVLSHVGATPFHTSTPVSNFLSGSTIPAVYNAYDISLRSDPTIGALVPNSLSDLMLRSNRFVPTLRASGTSPFLMGTTPYLTGSLATTNAGVIFDAASNRQGEDVVMGNVIGFDVRIFDPDARPRLSGSTPVYPHEQGYLALTSTASFSGGFVDLGCLPTANLTGLTAGGNGKLAGLAKTTATGTATYDTWSTHFESNGIDDDGVLGIDQGTNGGDDNSNGLPDDALEAEVPPPYGRRVPAIEVRIRCYDPASRQIRQTTVRRQFPD
jgi:hypothetical protein